MRTPIAAIVAVGVAIPALADEPPPQGSKPLSELLVQIEERADSQYFEEVEFEGGLYEIEYDTKDGEERKLRIDAVTGSEQG